jgi:hypothetical protein
MPGHLRMGQGGKAPGRDEEDGCSRKHAAAEPLSLMRFCKLASAASGCTSQSLCPIREQGRSLRRCMLPGQHRIAGRLLRGSSGGPACAVSACSDSLYRLRSLNARIRTIVRQFPARFLTEPDGWEAESPWVCSMRLSRRLLPTQSVRSFRGMRCLLVHRRASALARASPALRHLGACRGRA